MSFCHNVQLLGVMDEYFWNQELEHEKQQQSGSFA